MFCECITPSGVRRRNCWQNCGDEMPTIPQFAVRRQAVSGFATMRRVSRFQLQSPCGSDLALAPADLQGNSPKAAPGWSAGLAVNGGGVLSHRRLAAFPQRRDFHVTEAFEHQCGDIALRSGQPPDTELRLDRLIPALAPHVIETAAWRCHSVRSSDTIPRMVSSGTYPRTIWVSKTKLGVPLIRNRCASARFLVICSCTAGLCMTSRMAVVS